MTNLLALPNSFGKANRRGPKAKVLGRAVALYDALADRLRALVADVKKQDESISERSLSIGAGQSHAWLTSVINGTSKDPGGVALARLCENHGYSVRWLITGLGPKFIDRKDDERAAKERGEPLPPPRGSAVDELAERMLESRERK